MSALVSLLVLNVAFVAHLILSARRLPDPVASHFTFDGRADGWLRRRVYLAIVATIGPGLSVVSPVIVLALRNNQARLLAEHLAWVGCLLLGFIFGLHRLTVHANRTEPARLSMRQFWGLFAALAVGMIAWVLTFPN
jgi:hypothetical protein